MTYAVRIRTTRPPRRAAVKPPLLSAETLPALDAEFWARADRLLARAGDTRYVTRELAKMYTGLFVPLGAIKHPESIEHAVWMYRQLRAGAEHRFALKVSRERQDAVVALLQEAGYDV